MGQACNRHPGSVESARPNEPHPTENPGFRSSAYALRSNPGMEPVETEAIIIAAGAVVFLVLLVKQGAKTIRRRELAPVSRQWLLEQRGREEV